MKKIIFAALFLSSISVASASSSLKLTTMSSGKVLGTIKLNHNASNTGYYKIIMESTISDGHSQIRRTSTVKGIYNTYFNKYYIVDSQEDSLKSAINLALADVSFEICSDKSFSSCTTVKKQSIKINYSADTITGIFPNSFDVSV